MASIPEPLRDSSSLEKHLSCSICMELFRNPVTTSCGHSFCQGCLNSHIKYLSTMCPLCKTHINKTPGVNIVLRDVIEHTKAAAQNRYTGAAGEVACDVCTTSKMKAVKSCLVCLTSYCSAHLQSHSSQRLKGHKLVQPIKDLDARACLTHGRPYELYNRKQQACICVSCMKEGQNDVVSIEDEWNKRKVQLQSTKAELKEKVEKRKAKMEEVDAALNVCMDKLENEMLDVEAVFKAVFNILEAAQAAAMQPLEGRRWLLEKEAKELKDELEAEISKLQVAVYELEDISALEDHILFLQRFPSLANKDDMKDWTKVELDTSLSFGSMRKITEELIEKFQQELDRLSSIDLKRLSPFTVDVKLDPNTAHKRLALSEDGKEVGDSGEDQEISDSSGRFDLFGSVLGLNCFSSGRSYWEVEVGNKTGWDLGVATGGASRKGKLTLSPENGYWVLVHYEEEKYAAMASVPLSLFLKENPTRVGLFVDYEEGLVSFYDVRAQSHIYSFTACSFKEELYPYFSPHLRVEEKNIQPLVICSGKQLEIELDAEWKCLCSIYVDEEETEAHP
ncbi:E3 ubiquitin-protein ligase TRIM39 [Oryzias melastigma]|uniref:E3 ubiquitin-protein ligase TRIM39-like n=1 Tax=Oryzias melastigma TaxID=30732 RepID=A0A3B3CRM5_ORYME|nr:E3 ubiquitin-protein ligase TRIM39 [Oryzias melastigma]